MGTAGAKREVKLELLLCQRPTRIPTGCGHQQPPETCKHGVPTLPCQAVTIKPHCSITSGSHILTHAHPDPQVAPYPFTTLQPHLGAVSVGEEVSLTVADIPGLLPGAARNRGLGHAFLRHISRARALVYVVDASSGLGDDKASPRPWEQLQSLQVAPPPTHTPHPTPPPQPTANPPPTCINLQTPMQLGFCACSPPSITPLLLPQPGIVKGIVDKRGFEEVGTVLKICPPPPLH